MSTMEMRIDEINENCTKCVERCKECTCKFVDRLMRFAESMEKKGVLSKEDKEAYMAFMRG